MSELCCKFKIPPSNTVGGVGETRTVLRSVTYVRQILQEELRRLEQYYSMYDIAKLDISFKGT